MVVNLIIDGNFMIYRSLFISKGYKKDNLFLKSDNDVGVFVRKFFIDLLSSIKDISEKSKVSFKRIIFTLDYDSWRKLYYEDYKKNRKKDDSIDWDKLFKLIDKISEILKINGFIVTKLKMLEGDDLMYFYSDYFIKNNESSIIMTDDSDIIQLSNFYDNNNFVLVYSARDKKLYIDKRFKSFIENLNDNKVNDKSDVDLFFDSLNNYDLIFSFNYFLDPKNSYIDSRRYIIKKLFVGDKTDNITSSLIWYNDKDKNKTKSITDYFYNKNLLDVLENDGVFDMDFKVLESYLYNFNFKSLLNGKDIKENNLIRNYKLIVLSDATIPKDVNNVFHSFIKENDILSKSFDYNNNFNIKSFLSGTDYISDDFFINDGVILSSFFKNN